MKHTSRDIELSIWQLFAVILAAVACLLALAPVIIRHRSNKCMSMITKDSVKIYSNNVEQPLYHRRRSVRDVAPNDQCDVIPPLCSATTTLTTGSTTPSTRTTRTTVSTVSITRPVITNFPTMPSTTTPDPWANITRPYNSWLLPTFAKPIDYKLYISCPHCYSWIENLPVTYFYGKVTIRIDISADTSYIVLHAKKLNITEAKLTSGTPAIVTYLPEFEMIYLHFNDTLIPVGEVTLEINYRGELNERDNTGFYREFFWRSIGEVNYVLAANFQPIFARKAFPCFDEPNMPAKFSLSLEHSENETIAISNTDVAARNETSTTFQETPMFSTFAFSWALLPKDEFQLVTQTINPSIVNIWVRPELIGPSNAYLTLSLDIITKTFDFLKTYLGLADTAFPAKIDIIGVPDLTSDEKASTSYGLLMFREELLSTDVSLDSAEYIQSKTQVIAKHIIQMWFSKTDWWDNIWFGKSLSTFLAYKMMEIYYPEYKLLEQFPIREMVPLMMDDLKPAIWPVSNKNLTNNEELLDYLSVSIYSKGASLLRLLEHIVGATVFQSAVADIVSIDNASTILSTFYSKFDFNQALNTTITAEEFLRSWLEERNYPVVTVELTSNDPTTNSTSLEFRQTRYIASAALNFSTADLDYQWKIYMECDLGGAYEGEIRNLTSNYNSSRLRFVLNTSLLSIELPNEKYIWIKCNKDFYSYQVTEYVTFGDNPVELWENFESLFSEKLLSDVDKADLLNTAFVLPHGGGVIGYPQTVALIQELHYNSIDSYLAWSVFVWHWNYLMGVEEHSQYFYNFKAFATNQILSLYDYNIDNVVTLEMNHQEKLLKSMFFELLCRVQNTDALYKVYDLFRQIPESYFSNSTGNTNIPPEFLSTVLYYHIQNANDIDEWEYLWVNFTENEYKTAQQRNAILRALGSAKEIWQLKTLLEFASDFNDDVIEGQEYFDLINTISQNPNGRDVAWNFYRHNYENLVNRFGTSNRLFNELITKIVQSFENEYQYFEILDFIRYYPSSSRNQQLAADQAFINFFWLVDGLAGYLDTALSAVTNISATKTLIK